MIGYLQRHQNAGHYAEKTPQGAFRDRRGWVDHPVCGHLVFSHRTTEYTRETFDDAAHAHDHYELTVYLRGAVDYVTESAILSPSPGAAIWFPPETLHNTRLLTPCTYERYVFYFSPRLFSLEGKDYPPFEVLTKRRALVIPEEAQGELRDSLQHMDEAAEAGNYLLLHALILRFFSMLDRWSGGADDAKASTLPPKMAQIKDFLDASYSEIDSIATVSEHFFYSREHLSRLFKKYYNVSLSEYLTCLRVNHSLPLLRRGKGIGETGLQVGFQSISAFTSAFRRTMGILPSEYAKRYKAE